MSERAKRLICRLRLCWGGVVRDRANQESRLYGKLADELGTEDMDEATRRVRAWKKAAIREGAI